MVVIAYEMVYYLITAITRILPLIVDVFLMLGPSCRLPTASPGRWIGGRPPDMVASCDLSG